VCGGGVSKPANITRRLVVSETGVERDRVTLPTGMDPSRAPSMSSSRSVIQQMCVVAGYQNLRASPAGLCKGSKKTKATVEIKPPAQDGINNPVESAKTAMCR
jgi:hypothetical protein